jgi:hypothetical protein
VLVAHTCNPSYPGDRDQEDHDLKPTLGKLFTRPTSKKTHHKKRSGGVAKVLSSNPNTEKKSVLSYLFSGRDFLKTDAHSLNF